MQLELVKAPKTAPCYHLDGHSVHNGDRVDLHISGVEWLAVRLEGMPDQVLAYLPIAGGLEIVASLPVGADLRWPASRRLRPTTPDWRIGANAETRQVAMVRPSAAAREWARGATLWHLAPRGAGVAVCGAFVPVDERTSAPPIGDPLGTCNPCVAATVASTRATTAIRASADTIDEARR
jgi:hypothetical protein